MPFVWSEFIFQRAHLCESSRLSLSLDRLNILLCLKHESAERTVDQARPYMDGMLIDQTINKTTAQD